ncbi:hypothetical protein [Paenibacillus sp. GP183]|jgi:hypothetical protein|uniref:hypothetical protein n=1 Tax=Paenibacillus sp. GP183 TaxID=1882751 RepID=UPI000896659E|nr:hypothetical protein [Paenibacillus sp. GP183]SEC66474.1 hypothetical protein SAMN05443246_4905 [Paenibacillus sp. GP183]
MFKHGKRIGRILYVKTLGGKWIELRMLTGKWEDEGGDSGMAFFSYFTEIPPDKGLLSSSTLLH